MTWKRSATITVTRLLKSNEYSMISIFCIARWKHWAHWDASICWFPVTVTRICLLLTIKIKIVQIRLQSVPMNPFTLNSKRINVFCLIYSDYMPASGRLELNNLIKAVQCDSPHSYKWMYHVYLLYAWHTLDILYNIPVIFRDENSKAQCEQRMCESFVCIALAKDQRVLPVFMGYFFLRMIYPPSSWTEDAVSVGQKMLNNIFANRRCSGSWLQPLVEHCLSKAKQGQHHQGGNPANTIMIWHYIIYICRFFFVDQWVGMFLWRFTKSHRLLYFAQNYRFCLYITCLQWKWNCKSRLDQLFPTFPFFVPKSKKRSSCNDSL